MADSPKIPPSQIQGPKPLPGTPPRAEEPNARVVKLPDDFRSIRHAVKIKGEVTKIARDAASGETTVTVRTERGEIELKLDKSQPVPREGQRVEVTVQPSTTPGRAPEAATIRPAPEQSNPSRPAGTPIEIEIRPPSQPSPERPETRPAQAQPAYDPDAPWPQPGSVIRLQPLPAKDAAVIFTQDLPELIASSELQSVNFQTKIIAAGTQDEIAGQTLNIALPASVPVQEAARIIAEIIAPTKAHPQQQTAIAIPAPVIAAPTLQKPPTAVVQPQMPSATTVPPMPVAAPVLPAMPSRPQVMDVRIDHILPPQAELIPPGETQSRLPALLQMLKENPELQNQKAGSVTGIITAITPEKLPVLTVLPPTVPTAHSYVLQLPAEALITGTQIQFTPQVLHSAAPEPLLMPFASLLQPQPWPVMEDIYQALNAASPQIAQAFARIVPNPANPAQVTPAALFFIAAVRAGDITGWLGDKAIDALRRDGRGNLLSRLIQESGQISRVNAEPLSQDWRGIPLPMFWQGEIHKLALYYKQDQDSSEKDNLKGRQTRFIFDLTLSNMGKVQVDGLFRVNRLDLIVRTETAFSKAVQQDMRRTYTKAIEQANLHGELSFQNNPEQWVTISAAQERFGTSA